MGTLHALGRLLDFIVGSLIWSVVIVVAALVAPFALIGFFLWQIFYNTDRFFHLWLAFTPSALYMLATGDWVGKTLIGIPLVIIGWWIMSWWFRRMIRRKLRNWGYEGY